MKGIRKAAVIGAGTMGSGIAAHLANAGIDVILLDLDAARAQAGIQAQLKAGGFMHPGFAARVSSGSVGEDLRRLADADWIIEAVAERLDIKQQLYRDIAAVRQPHAIVSSNTSTISARTLSSGMPRDMAAHFLITHFFNPPRRMRLLEAVSGPDTLPAVLTDLTAFADIHLGKTVVHCRDTPGFIANRIGCYWLLAGLDSALRHKIPFDVADQILSRSFGIPSTGIFGLLDLIGLDLFPAIIRSLQQSLPPTDPLQRFDAEPAILGNLIAAGNLGRKSGSGFYRGGGRRGVREVLHMTTGDYRQADATRPSTLRATALLDGQHDDADFARDTILGTLAYSANLAPEIAYAPDDIDTAIRLGYGWEKGPFELAADLGHERLIAEARRMSHPLRVPLPEPAARSSANSATVAQRAGVRLRDMGDEVACLELQTRLNPIDPALLSAIEELVTQAVDRFGALVIASAGEHFSVGADLKHLLPLCESGDLAGLESFIRDGQRTLLSIKQAPIPIIGAAAGMALGGGCELLLHCTAIQAHAELKMGLVEARVGLLPGWGGSRELFLRCAEGGMRGPVAPTIRAFGLIRGAATSTSAFDARDLSLLRQSDGITMNRDRLLVDARQRALALMPNFVPATDTGLRLAGPSGASALRNILDTEALAGRLTDQDRHVGALLAELMTGGMTDPAIATAESNFLDLERSAFLRAAPGSAARIRLALGMPA